MLCARPPHPEPSLVWAAPTPDDPDSAFFLDDHEVDASFLVPSEGADMYGDLDGLLPRRGLLARLGRALKKEVTGHGPAEARLSGVIFLQRNASVRQLPSIAPKRDRVVRLPRARAMRPVRGAIVDPDPVQPTVVDPEPRPPPAPQRAMRWRPGRPRPAAREPSDRGLVERIRSLPIDDVPTEPLAHLPRARRRKPTMHYRARSSSPAPAVRRESSPVPRYEKDARRVGDPLRSSTRDTMQMLPRPRSRADPSIVMLQPPPPPPSPIARPVPVVMPPKSRSPSELSAPISEYEKFDQLDSSSDSGSASEAEPVNVDDVVLHIESDDSVAHGPLEENQLVEAEAGDVEKEELQDRVPSPSMMRSPMLSSSGGASASEASTSPGWRLARSDGSTIRSEGTPSPHSGAAGQSATTRRRPAWEASRRPAWIAKRSGSDEIGTSKAFEPMRAERKPEPIEPVSERVRRWPHPAALEYSVTPVRRPMPRTARHLPQEEGRQQRIQSDFTTVLGMRQDDFIDFQCRPRNRARGMRILSNVSSAFIESEQDDDAALDDHAGAASLSGTRRPVASVLRRARLLNRFA